VARWRRERLRRALESAFKLCLLTLLFVLLLWLWLREGPQQETCIAPPPPPEPLCRPRAQPAAARAEVAQPSYSGDATCRMA